jgi:hypothetical protein
VLAALVLEATGISSQEKTLWYKTNGPGYQTRINAVLRMYMQAKSGSSRRTPTGRHLRKSQTPKK